MAETIVSPGVLAIENDLINVNSINWFDLEFELREVMESFPARYIDFNVDLMSIEDLDREQQFYIFRSDGNSYLVDTQGYTYPRYIVELEGFGETNDQIDNRFHHLETCGDKSYQEVHSDFVKSSVPMVDYWFLKIT